jgi:hypothetical protein
MSNAMTGLMMLVALSGGQPETGGGYSAARSGGSQYSRATQLAPATWSRAPRASIGKPVESAGPHAVGKIIGGGSGPVDRPKPGGKC